MTISFCWKYNRNINILASTHSDGRFGAIVGKYFRLNNIPISSKESNATLKTVLQKLKQKEYIGITPDGPRGPKEIVSEGIIKISRATKTPIIPCGFWSSKKIKLNTWDSFLITLPFSSCCFVWQEPMYIPKDTKDDEIEQFQELLKKRIDDCIDIAKKNI